MSQMQAIILAAGKGTRMRPLTNFVPKPMVRFLDSDGIRRNLVEHNIALLPPEVDEIIFVVGYLKEQIMNHFGDYFDGRKVRYVVQDEALGTGHAVRLVQQYVTGRFLVMMSDDLYCKEDIDAIIATESNALLAQHVDHRFSGGNIVLNESGYLQEIIEGEHVGGLINAALYALTPEFFNYEMVAIHDGAEYGLPQTLAIMAQDFDIAVLMATHWRQVSNLEDIQKISQQHV